MNIIWSRLAKITYLEIMENLDEQGGRKEIITFKKLTNELLEKIKNEQIACPYVNEKISIQQGFVHKNVSLFYKLDSNKKEIYLLTFFNNRMTPETLIKLLKDSDKNQ